MYDRGTEFTSDFDDLLSRLATHSKIIPVEAHWKGGTTERHGGILRTIARKLVDHHNCYEDCDLRVVIQEATAAKNSFSRRSGFSPAQWVLGYDSALPGSVLDRPQDLAVHGSLEAGNSENEQSLFAQRMSMRETARKAWHELDNSDRLRRALLSKPKQQRECFLPGELVYFYHLQQAGRAPKSRGDDPTCWHGPATVVAQQGSSTVWISWRRPLLRIATENVRAATEDEQVGSTLVEHELDDHEKELTKGGSKSRGFLDLLDTAAPVPTQPPDTRPRFRLSGKQEPTSLYQPPSHGHDSQPSIEDGHPDDEVQIDSTVQAERGSLAGDESPRGYVPVDEQMPDIPDDHVDPLVGVQAVDQPPSDMSEPARDTLGDDVPLTTSDIEDENMTSLPMSGRATLGGQWEEFPVGLGPRSTYGPDRTWRHHLRERADKRASVGVQSHAMRKISAKDFLFAEMGFLLEQEHAEPDLSVHDTGDSVVFEHRNCLACGCRHRCLTWG